MYNIKFLLLIFCLTTSLFADFTLSPNSTSQFFAEHLGKEKVVGTFSNMSAPLSSPKAINTKKEVITLLLSNNFELKIPVNSLKTKNKVRDKHLKSRVFFNEKKYPTITFSNISSISPSGNQFIISGQLTIKETQVPLQLLTTITIEKQDPKTKEVASFILDATHILNRRNHDLAFYKKMIGDKITTTTKLHFIKK